MINCVKQYYFKKPAIFLKPKLAQKFTRINSKWTSTTTFVNV